MIGYVTWKKPNTTLSGFRHLTYQSKLVNYTSMVIYSNVYTVKLEKKGKT